MDKAWFARKIMKAKIQALLRKNRCVIAACLSSMLLSSWVLLTCWRKPAVDLEFQLI
jgi:hypothetical protein